MIEEQIRKFEAEQEFKTKDERMRKKYLTILAFCRSAEIYELQNEDLWRDFENPKDIAPSNIVLMDLLKKTRQERIKKRLQEIEDKEKENKPRGLPLKENIFEAYRQRDRDEERERFERNNSI